MTQSFVVVSRLQVTVAKTTVNVRQQRDPVAHVLSGPAVQFLQHLSGLLEAFLVLGVGLRCNMLAVNKQELLKWHSVERIPPLRPLIPQNLHC